MRRTFVALLLVLSLSAAAYLAWKGVAELMDRRAGTAYYARLSQSVGDSVDVRLPEPTARRPEDEPLASVTDVERPQPVSEIDFDSLRMNCPDVVGWIRIEGTVIDYPVARGEDNLFYLSHLPDRTANSAGSIMMDCACDPGFGSIVSILHGHHMRSGAMFGDLDEYAAEAYFQAHPTLRLFTPEGDFDVEIFAACTVDGRDFGYPTDFADEAAFNAFVADLQFRTGYDTGASAQWGDRVLLLSTCAYSFDTARFVVAGRIVENEAGETDFAPEE